MAHIIKQPNGLFAVFSTTTDTFIGVDGTVEELIEDRVEEARIKIEAEVKGICDKLNAGDKP